MCLSCIKQDSPQRTQRSIAVYSKDRVVVRPLVTDAHFATLANKHLQKSSLRPLRLCVGYLPGPRHDRDLVAVFDQRVRLRKLPVDRDLDCFIYEGSFPAWPFFAQPGQQAFDVAD